MSWSFSANGRADQIGIDMKTYINSQTCNEPEQTIKGMARDLMTEALEHFPEGQQVALAAWGSQSGPPDEDGCAANTLHVEITPIYAEAAGLARAG